MRIVLQYFDGCPNWMVAAERLDSLTVEFPDVTVARQAIETVDDAVAAGFRGSPSILLNGEDLFPDPGAQVGLACRVYVTANGLAGSPTVEQLRTALTNNIGATKTS